MTCCCFRFVQRDGWDKEFEGEEGKEGETKVGFLEPKLKLVLRTSRKETQGSWATPYKTTNAAGALNSADAVKCLLVSSVTDYKLQNS